VTKRTTGSRRRGQRSVGPTTPVGLRRFDRRILAVVCCLYVVFGIGLSGVEAVSRAVVVLAALLVVLLAAGALRSAIRLPRYIWLPLPFMAYTACSIAWGGLDAWRVLGSMFTAWAGTFAVAVALSNGVAWGSLETGMILAVLANLLAWYAGVDVSTEPSVRATGLVGNSNELAAAAVGMALVAWGMREHFSRPGPWLLLAAALVVTQVTASRLGLLMLVGVLGLCLARLAMRRTKILLAIALPLVVAGVFAYRNEIALELTSRSLAVARVGDMLARADNSGKVRAELISAGWQAYLSRPIFGFGLVSFERATGLPFPYAHNNWIEVALNGGLIGLILFYSMHARVLGAWLASRRVRNSIGLLLVGTLVVADVAWVSYYSRVYALILACMCAAAVPVARRASRRLVPVKIPASEGDSGLVCASPASSG
jgi:O-antigen ligase